MPPIKIAHGAVATEDRSIMLENLRLKLESDKPQVVVTFTTSPDDKAVHKLTVGSADNQAFSMAKIDEREGFFLLSSPAINALKSSLIQPPATPTPSPGPSGSPIPSPSVAATAR